MKRYILFTVFISGMTTLAAELAAGRLIGNVFGTSNIVWASIIGLILIYLTLGYFLGGKWADANPTPVAMYRILAWGAFTLGLVPYIARPVLRSAASAFEFLQVGILGGSFIAVLILFIVPITLLGTEEIWPSQMGEPITRMSAAMTLSWISGQSSIYHPCCLMSG